MRRWAAAALAALLLFSLTGCWSREEINELAIVVAMGWDHEPGPAPYRVTMQIARVGALIRGAAQGQSQKHPVEVITGVGRTPYEAVRLLQRGIPRRFHTHHNEVWVIGEELARRGIGPVYDLFERSEQVHPNVLVLVARGAAREVLQRSEDLEKTLSEKVTGLMRFRTYTGTTVRVTVNELGVVLSQPGHQVILPGITLEPGSVDQGSPAVELRELAIFRDDRMIDWMPPSHTLGLLWSRNRLTRTTFTLPCPDEPDRSLSLELDRARASRHARLVQGRPAIGVRAEIEATLQMQECSANLATPETIVRLNSILQEALSAQIAESIRYTQERRSDVFGFGEALGRNAPHYWAGVRDVWDDELYPTLEPTVTVRARVRNVGLVSDPLPVR